MLPKAKTSTRSQCGVKCQCHPNPGSQGLSRAVYPQEHPEEWDTERQGCCGLEKIQEGARQIWVADMGSLHCRDTLGPAGGGKWGGQQNK